MGVGDPVLLFDFEMGGARDPLTYAVTWHMEFPFGRDSDGSCSSSQFFML
jgi:hypothetical protein